MGSRCYVHYGLSVSRRLLRLVLHRTSSRPNMHRHKQWNMKYKLLFVGLLFIVLVYMVIESFKVDDFIRMKCRNYVVVTDSSDSSRAKIRSSHGFQTVDGLNDTYVYSAFFDTRKQQVRVVAAVKNRTLTRLYCHLVYHSGHVISPAFIANINENHDNRITSAYILCESCVLPVPRVISVTTWNHVNSPSYFLPITHDDSDLLRADDTNNAFSGHKRVPLEHKADINHRRKNKEMSPGSSESDTLMTRGNQNKTGFLYACLSPLHAKFGESDRLVEWFELNRILGVEYFTVYVENITEEVRHVLKYYEKLGIVELLPWDIPIDDIHYHGQLAAINDCLYRNKPRTKFLMITDADEFIIPQRVAEYTLHDLFKVIGQNRSIYMFQHTRFNSDAYKKSGQPFLITQNVIQRTKLINPPKERSKLIVSTDNIVTLGIHEIWAARLGVATHVVDPGIGLLHHYRSDADTEFSTEHNVTWKYKDRLDPAVRKVYTHLHKGSPG